LSLFLGGLFLLFSAFADRGGFLRSLLSLKNADDDLLLFDEKSSDDSFSNSGGAQVTAVCPGDPLVSLWHVLKRCWTRGFDSLKLDTSVAASWNFGGLLLVQVNKFATGSFGDAPFVTQRGVRHPTAKAKSLNHDYS